MTWVDALAIFLILVVICYSIDGCGPCIAFLAAAAIEFSIFVIVSYWVVFAVALFVAALVCAFFTFEGRTAP